LREAADYVRLAGQLDGSTSSRIPTLLITFGVSGSGKSVLARALIPTLPAVVIRADVERRRLYPAAEGRYNPEAHAATYARLLSCAGQALAGGFNVVLDATFVRQAGRRDARNLAEAMGAGFGILAPSVAEELLRQRVASRHAAGTDASEANLDVLTMQMAEVEPLTEGEVRLTQALDASGTPEALAAEVRRWLQARMA